MKKKSGPQNITCLTTGKENDATNLQQMNGGLAKGQLVGDENQHKILRIRKQHAQQIRQIMTDQKKKIEETKQVYERAKEEAEAQHREATKQKDEYIALLEGLLKENQKPRENKMRQSNHQSYTRHQTPVSLDSHANQSTFHPRYQSRRTPIGSFTSFSQAKSSSKHKLMPSQKPFGPQLPQEKKKRTIY